MHFNLSKRFSRTLNTFFSKNLYILPIFFSLKHTLLTNIATNLRFLFIVCYFLSLVYSIFNICYYIITFILRVTITHYHICILFFEILVKLPVDLSYYPLITFAIYDISVSYIFVVFSYLYLRTSDFP